MFIKNLIKSSIYILVISLSLPIKAQTDQNLEKTILELDKKFWKVYNHCDSEGFKTFLTEDLEFYHDKGGLTDGRIHLITSVKENLCNPKNPRVRREEVKGSVKVYPLKNYGAIIVGEHKFYVTEKGKKEVLAEIAKFTHVWQYKNNEWRMSRVLSYDHQPATKNNPSKEISLSDDILVQYLGTYQAPQTGTVRITKKGSLLHMKANNMEAILYPESEKRFFHKHAPLSFEFVKDTNGQVIKMVVREKGTIVEEAKKM